MTAERPFAQIRREQGRSRLAAATLLGISPGYLAQLERGARPLTLPMAERLCCVYGVDLNALSAWDGQR